MFTIGIDPHKGTHTAAVLDGTETVVDELRLVADRHQHDRLLCFATRFEPRTWAIEGAGGLGALLDQQVVAAGESVLDVPPSLSARVRLLNSTPTDKTDSHDARAAAIVAMRHDGSIAFPAETDLRAAPPTSQDAASPCSLRDPSGPVSFPSATWRLGCRTCRRSGRSGQATVTVSARLGASSVAWSKA